MKTAILYHQIKPGTDCPDGVAAAWVAWMRYHEICRQTVDVIGCVYQSEPPDVSAYDRIVIVDFSFPRDVIARWAAVGKEIELIDHHKTAQEHLGDISTFAGAVTIKFDMAECGATLAWKHFTGGGEPPAFLRYVRDRDLWNFEFPKSEEIHEAVSGARFQAGSAAKGIGLDPLPLIFAIFNQLAPLTEDELIASLGPVGDRLLAPKREKIAIAAHRWELEKLPEPRSIDLEIPIVRCLWDGSEDRLVSDVCAKLYRELCPDAPFVGCITSDGKYSLRSDKNGGNYDVSAIAKYYGGGGHHNAAGFGS